MPRHPIVLRCLLLMELALPAALAAQVGHAPEKSPYRDIRYGSYFVLLGGSASGSGGEVGVAPHDGNTVGLRWTFLGNKSVSLGLGLVVGSLDRLVQDPLKSVAERTSGPFSRSVVWLDVPVQFNLTGGKTWHGLAPFVGGALGLAFAGKAAQDTSGFRMGTKFTIAPFAGTRLFVAPRLYLHFEARYQLWQVRYPSVFSNGTGPDQTPVLRTGSLTEWTSLPWLQVGLGWAVALPF